MIPFRILMKQCPFQCASPVAVLGKEIGPEVGILPVVVGRGVHPASSESDGQVEEEEEEEEDDDEEEEDDDEDEVGVIVAAGDPTVVGDNALEASYLVKRMSVGAGSVCANPSPVATRYPTSSSPAVHTLATNSPAAAAAASKIKVADPAAGAQVRPTWGHDVKVGDVPDKVGLLSVILIVLLTFLFCSSLYLVFRVHELQMQVRVVRTSCRLQLGRPAG